MRDVQTWRILSRVAQQNEIEIERAWGAWIRAFAAVVEFDGEEGLEEVARSESRLSDGDGIQVEGLIGEPLPFGFGFDGVRQRDVGDERAQPFGGERDGSMTISQIAADRDGDPQRSVHLTPSTPPP